MRFSVSESGVDRMPDMKNKKSYRIAPVTFSATERRSSGK